MIREAAHAYARADRAMICWTLGITEHHNAVDNVLALINLALLTGHVGRYGSGVNPLRGQNNVQGGGDMGAIPNRLVGFQDWTNDPAIRARFERAWGVPLEAALRQEHDPDVRGDGARRDARASTSSARTRPSPRRTSTGPSACCTGLDHLVVQDIFLTATARVRARGAARVARAGARRRARSPTASGGCSGFARRCEPPGDARDEMWIICRDRPSGSGHDWGHPIGRGGLERGARPWRPIFAGMSYARLEQEGGLHWPCYDENHPGELFLHSRLWKEPVGGPPAPFSVVEHEPPVERPDAEYPFLLTTGRRLDSYNTGVQTGGYTSPLRRGESLDISPEDAERLRRIERRPGAGHLAARQRRRPGAHRSLAARRASCFMTLHFQDEVKSNLLTIDETDPKSGTAEFKACAVRVEPVRSEPTRRRPRSRMPRDRSVDGSPSAGRRPDRRGARGGRCVARSARRPAGTAGCATRRGTRIPRPAATPPRPPAPAPAGAPGRRNRASAGSARARSTTSASG